MCNCCNMTQTAVRKSLQPLWSILRVLENFPVIGHLVAAFYGCCCLKDKAERAGLKASVGLCCVVCNAPAETIDEVVRYRSDKLYSTSLTRRPDWMQKFPLRNLQQLCLPATHQSGTYYMDHKLQEIPLIEGWSRCQNLTIMDQLIGGVRFFDIRLMTDDKTKEIWLHHNVVACITFKSVLEQVRDFVSEYPSEIVGLYLSNDGKSLDWGQVHTCITEFLASKLMNETMKTMRIGDIVENGKNVMVFGVPGVAYSWRCMSYRWPNKPWPPELEEDMKNTLGDMSLHNPHQLFWYKAECTPNAMAITRSIGGLPGVIVSSKCDEKYEFLEEMAYAVNYRVMTVLEGTTRLPFNVLSVDFIHDDIVSRIIDLNANDETGTGRYGIVGASTGNDELDSSLPAVVVDMSIPSSSPLLQVWESNM